MKVSLVTPTRNRPVSFGLVERWIERQTLWSKPGVTMEWIVVNDGKAEYQYKMGQIVCNRQPQPKEGFSFCLNLIMGLSAVRGDLVYFIEDDDWMHPTLLERLWQVWDRSEGKMLVLGFTHALYYDVRRLRARECRNSAHSSLGSTAIGAAAISATKNILRCNKATIDGRLWRHAKRSNWLRYLGKNEEQSDGRWLHVGLKCMPGEPGIGDGHRDGRGTLDADHRIIKRWIGIDYADVEPYCTPCQCVDANASKTSPVPKV